MENNYSVYQHVTPDGMYYFGQTQNVERRWRNNGALYKGTALQPYIEKYGWENIQHIVLFKDQTKEDALWIEDFLITTAQEDGVCINKNRSGLVSKEEGYKQRISKHHYEQNKEQIREQKKQYYKENREQKKQYYEEKRDKFKEYYEQNKEQIMERKKQYYEQNKEQIREWKKQYYEQNKEQIREQRRQRYQRKKQEKQFKELGYLPLF